MSGYAYEWKAIPPSDSGVASVSAVVGPKQWLYCRVSSKKLYQGGSSVIIMKGGHDQIKSRCGFYSKLGYCEEVFEEFGGGEGTLES